MANIKTDEEIAYMREGGALLSRSLQAAIDMCRPGVNVRELDAIARKSIEAGGGKPSFLGYKGGGDLPFPSTVCISRNNEVVHGTADRDVILEDGDILGLDIGCWYKGLCTDMAVTVPIGNVSEETMELLRATRDSMRAGVAAALAGGQIDDISIAVQDSIDEDKYGIVRALVGHGVGHEVHEKPHVPNFRSKMSKGVGLEVGMCLAIEPMVTLGAYEVKTLDDGWTIATKDGSLAAHFEVTIAVLEGGPELLTPEPRVEL
jgi:methionyl aminopeptidase